jgi:hypothetical protein
VDVKDVDVRRLQPLERRLEGELHRLVTDEPHIALYSYRDGESETWIGEWMQQRQNRDELVIATKYTNTFHPSGPQRKEKFAEPFDSRIRRIEIVTAVLEERVHDCKGRLLAALAVALRVSLAERHGAEAERRNTLTCNQSPRLLQSLLVS